MSLTPFHLHVPDTTLDRIRERVASFRWADFCEPEDAGDWRHGPPAAWMRDLCAYWVKHYDWREAESALNVFPHFTTDIDGQTLHIIYEHGSGPSPRPLLLIHGWPYSFASY